MPAVARPFLLVFLSIAALVAPTTAVGQDAGGSQVRPCKGAAVTLNLVEADLDAVVALVSKVTGKRFVLTGSKTPAKITVVSPRPVCPDEVYEVFLSALAMNGLTVVKRGSFHVVTTMEGAVRGPIPVVVER